MRALLLLVALLLGPMAAGATFPVASDAETMQRTLAWVRDRTRADGCIGAEPTGPCSHYTTRDMVILLSALGADPRQWSPGDLDPVSYLRDHRAGLEAETGACPACGWAKTIVALEASNEDPRAFGGFDYVARLDGFFDGVQMGGPSQVNDDAWALFAYAGLDAPPTNIVDRVRMHLDARQNPTDGGWSWNLGTTSEPWGTSVVLLALLRTGTPADSPSVARAVEFLASQEIRDGLMLQEGSPSSETTAIVAQALRAAARDPAGPAWTRDGRSLMDGLLAMQAADGSFAHNAQGGAPYLATTQVPPALRGLPYPFRPPTLSLVLPAASAEVGRDVEVRAEARDAEGAVRVRWTVDGIAAGEGSTWRGRFSATGSHLVVATVEDGHGVTRTAQATIEANGPTGSAPPPAPNVPPEPTDTSLVPLPVGASHAAPAVPWAFVAGALVALGFVKRRR